MRVEHINHDSTKLLIFFCGFYTDANCFAEFDNCKSDILFVWDYSELNYDIFEDFDFTPYVEINLIAYSYGVWAAAQAIKQYLPPLNQSAAISGTMTPVDDNLGVPSKIFDIMLNALSWDTLEKFEKKMLEGVPEAPKKAERTLENLRDELENVKRNKDLNGCDVSLYDKVILTTKDRIFPYRSQAAFWQEHRNKTELECGHFPFYRFKDFDEILIS